MLIKLGHTSVLEHAVASFKISDVSRSLTHQLVRHRIASYTQKSQRYVDESTFEYVTPDKIKENEAAFDIYNNFMNYCKETYKKLKEIGIPKKMQGLFYQMQQRQK